MHILHNRKLAVSDEGFQNIEEQYTLSRRHSKVLRQAHLSRKTKGTWRSDVRPFCVYVSYKWKLQSSEVLCHSSNLLLRLNSSAKVVFQILVYQPCSENPNEVFQPSTSATLAATNINITRSLFGMFVCSCGYG